MPRVQSTRHSPSPHLTSPPKPKPMPKPTTQSRSKLNNNRANKLLPKPSSTLPVSNLVAPKSTQRSSPKSNNLSTDPISPLVLHETHQPLSLSSFCDQLSAEIYSHRSFKSRSHSKLKSSSRKSKKKSVKHHHELILPPSSDVEEVHAIYLPTPHHPSRSTTPTPTKSSQMGFLSNDQSTLALDEFHISSPPTQPKPSQNLFRTSASAAPSRRHLRAKSVASIFELGGTTQSSLSFSNGVRDDWDMPVGLPPRDITRPQKEKSPVKNIPQVPASSHLARKLNQHDPKAHVRTNVSVNQLTKEVPLARPSKSTLARTSSAGTIKRFTKPVQALNSTPSYSSRSDDESALTWQQTIIRPAPKHSLFSSQSDHPLAATDAKPVHKKPQAIPNGFTTPIKGRNSLSFGHAPTNQSSPITSFQPHTGSLGLEAGQDTLAWKSCPSSAVNHHPDLPPLYCNPNPLPIAGAQFDQTPPRRHTKSYTHHPATLSIGRPTQSSHQTTSASVFANIPESKHHKMMTPSKSRSTSEDLHLASPGKQLATPALRAGFMYAGPQFHNSPCPQALPAPKFSFGSA